MSNRERRSGHPSKTLHLALAILYRNVVALFAVASIHLVQTCPIWTTPCQKKWLPNTKIYRRWWPQKQPILFIPGPYPTFSKKIMNIFFVLAALTYLVAAQRQGPNQQGPSLNNQQGVNVSVRPANVRGDVYLSRKNNLIVSQKQQKNPAQLMVYRGMLVDNKSKKMAHLAKDHSLVFDKTGGTSSFAVSQNGRVTFQNAGFIACDDGQGVYQIKPDVAGSRNSCKNPQQVAVSAYH